MTLNKFASELNLVARVLPNEIIEETGYYEVTGCYIGDLLSWVMSKAKEGQAWLTVMGNPNVIAVAKLTDVACVILCENAPLDEEAAKQAEANGIAVYMTEKTSYELAIEIEKLLKK